MSVTKSELRPALRSGPCEKCGEHIAESENHILTFHGGKFVIIHEDCADFMDHATKGPRTTTPTRQP